MIALDNFHEARGWDKKTGWPMRTKLEELDLRDVADELASIERLAEQNLAAKRVVELQWVGLDAR
jgi:hypothetical protein